MIPILWVGYMAAILWHTDHTIREVAGIFGFDL